MPADTNEAFELLAAGGTERLSDEVIVARVLAREPGLFELLMRRYNRRLFRAVRAVIRDDAEAEDVVQDAWCRAYGHLSEFAGRATFATWVTRIGIYEALARLRRAGRFEPLEDDDAEATSSSRTPEQYVGDDELRRVLEEAIDELPESFRTVFVLRTVEGMSVAETAECLGIAQQTVKTRAFRARVLLQQKLSARIDETASKIFDFGGARCDRIVAGVMARIAVVR